MLITSNHDNDGYSPLPPPQHTPNTYTHILPLQLPSFRWTNKSRVSNPTVTATNLIPRHQVYPNRGSTRGRAPTGGVWVSSTRKWQRQKHACHWQWWL